MIANRRRLGTISRKSSSRLPARSGAWTERPVTLPPGRARLVTRPVPSGSVATPNTIGNTGGCLFGREDCTSRRDNDIDLEPDELGGDFAIALIATFCPAILDRDGAALDPAKFAQPLDESGNKQAPGRRRGCA